MESAQDRSRDSSPLATTTKERLLQDIVCGTYPPGSRLPAERDLAKALGASRATLREAFRQLDTLNLISARRGSGVTVRPVRDWSLEVLPLYLAAGAPHSQGGVHELASEMLMLRRELVVTMLRVVAPRCAPGSLATARVAAHHAWDARQTLSEFARREMLALKEVAAAARVLPTQWLLNSLADVYVQCALIMPTIALVPKDYLEVFEDVVLALEGGDLPRATLRMQEYYERNDGAFLKRLAELVA